MDAERPTDLPSAEILRVVKGGTYHDAEYGRAVILTVSTFACHQWTERQATSTELGAVETVLSDGGLKARGRYVPGRKGAASDLLEGWRDFLEVPDVAEEAAGHAAIVRKLIADQPIGWIMLRKDHGSGKVVIADGRHRLFAVLDVAEKRGERLAPVLFGERVQ